MARWRVVDWMNNEMFDGKTFDSFDDARAYIDEMGDKIAYEMYPEDEEAREEFTDGYSEDLYAMPVKG